MLGYGLLYSLWLIFVGIAGLLVLPVRLWKTGADALAIGTKNILGVVFAAVVILLTVFGLVQLVAARKRIAELTVMIGRRIDQATRIGGLVVTLSLIAVGGALAPWLAGTRNDTARRLWADLLPAAIGVLAAFRAGQTIGGERGSRWRVVFALLCGAAVAISVAEVCDFSSTGPVGILRWIAVALAVVAMAFGGRLLFGSLQGTLLACWAPLFLGLVLLSVPGAPHHFGALLISGGIVVGARVFRRPFSSRRRLADIPTSEPPGGRREALHLRRGFEFLAESLVVAIAELFGKSERVAFLTAANTAAVDAGWPMWFVESGKLVDRVDAPITDRAAIYRGALHRFVVVAGAASDPAIAMDAVIESRLSLPPRLGLLIDEHLGSSLAPLGRETLGLEGRTGPAAVRFALRHLVRTILRCVDETAGGPAVEQIVNTVNRRAAANSWGLWCRSNGQLADNELARMEAPEDVAAGFLAIVCTSTAEALGSLPCRRAVQFSIDTLARDLHPVALQLLGASPWAESPTPRRVHPVVVGSWPIPA